MPSFVSRHPFACLLISVLLFLIGLSIYIRTGHRVYEDDENNSQNTLEYEIPNNSTGYLQQPHPEQQQHQQLYPDSATTKESK